MTETKEAAYRRRQAERGLKQCLVWAPVRDCDRIRSYARELTEQFEKEQKEASEGQGKER
ncbi:MAG: hypothetical protein K9L88_18600 [Chromatiaceae bacterium]|nr:hypothetical protein [Chromatiaceae bacterium]